VSALDGCDDEFCGRRLVLIGPFAISPYVKGELKIWSNKREKEREIIYLAIYVISL